MIFQYQALDRTGKTVSDYIDAPSEASARQKVRGQGLYLVKLVKQEVATAPEAPGGKTSFRALAEKIAATLSLRFGTKQLGLFSRQLATLLKAGLPLPVAITDIVDQIDNKQFRNIIADIKEKIEQGSSFSNALAQHKAIFPDMYISMVRVGESLGSLDHVIARLADLEEKQNILTSKIRSAMYYPAFMLLFAMAVTAFLMTSVIPTIAGMFEEQHQALPLVTKLIIGLSTFM
ncbi:MAG TPA: type II secretion system F family protein, partial [Spirochaetota bacterium]|nr:type II secretion system F family protein [Spirochaetota bacterium]